MKKVIIMILILSCMALLISSCNKTNNDNASLKFSFGKNGDYTGFTNFPNNFIIQEVKDAGYFVIQDLEVIANENVWHDFIETSLRKENTGVRIVRFFKDSVDDPFFLDLFYNDGYYYLFDSSSKNQGKQPYLHLMTLDGKFGNPLRDSGAIVLTNDDALTFDMVMKATFSSNTDVIKSIPPFRIVMFK